MAIYVTVMYENQAFPGIPQIFRHFQKCLKVLNTSRKGMKNGGVCFHIFQSVKLENTLSDENSVLYFGKEV